VSAAAHPGDITSEGLRGATENKSSTAAPSGKTRDVGTQYTPPGYPPTATSGIKPSTVVKTEPESAQGKRRDLAERGMEKTDVVMSGTPEQNALAASTPPRASKPPERSSKPTVPTPASETHTKSSSSISLSSLVQHMPSSPKKARSDNVRVKLMPRDYMKCNVQDLGVIISDMLLELIAINDEVPPKGVLTRFHSRAPPTISVRDYLNRLIFHATLSPPLLLATVYYIDRLCALYPAFTITSLTVHRFLITAATVAAKGLSDSFWTNHTYSRVGGVSTHELAMLELDFLGRLDWGIIPKAEVLEDYYRSLVARADDYAFETGSEESSSNGTGEST
jgi:cyclin-like protein